MKNKKYFTITIVAIFFSSLLFGLAKSSNNIVANTNEEGIDLDLLPNILGDIDHSFATAFGMWEIEYLNGLIYGVDGTTTRLYVYDAVTGVNTVNYTIPFPSYGLATDGTYLYTTIATGVQPNGTIIKLDLTGNEISRIHIPIAANILYGLAWDGDYLWAFQFSPASFLRIDFETEVISRNITATTAPHGMTWYNDLLWVENYGTDHTAAINPLTGSTLYTFSAPYHLDSGLTNNGTHFIQSSYAAGPFEISFTKMASEIGDIFSESITYSSNMLDITFDGTSFFFAENNSDWITTCNAVNSYVSTVWSSGINPVGITLIDDVLVMSEEDAPYNIYTFTKAGTMIANDTALDVMINSLAYDGTYLWAMGSDNILYKLNPLDISIISEYSIGAFKGITYDYVNNVIWAVSRQEHKIRYFDITKEQLGTNAVNLTVPITTTEYGLTFDGEYLVITTSAGGGHYYRLIPCELDEEPIITPTTPFEGLFGLSNLYENLLYVGFGIVGTAIISFVIAILVRRKRA